MKLIDNWYFGGKIYARTDEERAAKLRETMREQNETLLKKASNQQQKREQTVKMNSVKKYLVCSKSRSYDFTT